MSALVNLAKFREEKLAGYVEGQRAAEELQQRIWELEDQKQALVRHFGLSGYPCSALMILWTGSVHPWRLCSSCSLAQEHACGVWQHIWTAA